MPAPRTGWVSIKAPPHVARSLKLLVDRVSMRGLVALGKDLADPIECPGCGARLLAERAEDRALFSRCPGCGYEATRADSATMGQLTGVAIDHLHRLLRENEAK